MTTRFPLAWPANVPRKPQNAIRKGAFGQIGARNYKEALTVSVALGRLQKELDLLGVQDEILSTNIPIRLDGLPRSSQAEPDDPGVALYFKRKGKDICLPCDSFTKVADNIAGIAAHIKALRDIERYGVASVQQMFTGFEQLPAPGQHVQRTWREIFGFSASEPVVGERSLGILNSRYRHLAKECRSEEELKELNIARDKAVQDITGKVT